MDSDGEQTPKLPLLLTAHAHMESPERPGMITSPIRSVASVPFRWEEEPGKPKPSRTLSCDFSQKCLELPPRLLIGDVKVPKLPSPTTVLEGPYMGRSRFQSSSFRIGSDCYGSFRSFSSPDHETRGQQLGALVLSRRGHKGRGFLSSWRRRVMKGKREVGGGSYVFPSSVDRESEYSREGEETGGNGTYSTVRLTRITRTRSSSSLSSPRSHFWATIYEGLKQVVPWRSKKLRREMRC